VIKVLIVDDDFMVARVHAGFVAALDGFEVVGTASTGAEALAAADRLSPDLVLLDVYLPDMTGLEVLQRLRSAGDPVGVVMITAARELGTVTGALDGGAADYLIKPFEFAALRTKLEAFAARADALKSTAGADQSLIDSLFRGSGASGAPDDPMPKGLGAVTGQLVLDALREAGEVSAAECAELVGISRVSARRYLEHFLSVGALDLNCSTVRVVLNGATGWPGHREAAPSALSDAQREQNPRRDDDEQHHAQHEVFIASGVPHAGDVVVDESVRRQRRHAGAHPGPALQGGQGADEVDDLDRDAPHDHRNVQPDAPGPANGGSRPAPRMPRRRSARRR